MEYVELDQEMDMPCRCPECGKWHELNDSKRSLRNKDKLICPECYHEERTNMVQVGSLKKNDRFEYQGGDFTVTRKWRSINTPMSAKTEWSKYEKEFYYDDEEVYKLPRKKNIKS